MNAPDSLEGDTMLWWTGIRPSLDGVCTLTSIKSNTKWQEIFTRRSQLEWISSSVQPLPTKASHQASTWFTSTQRQCFQWTMRPSHLTLITQTSLTSQSGIRYMTTDKLTTWKISPHRASWITHTSRSKGTKLLLWNTETTDTSMVQGFILRMVATGHAEWSSTAKLLPMTMMNGNIAEKTHWLNSEMAKASLVSKIWLPTTGLFHKIDQWSIDE